MAKSGNKSGRAATKKSLGRRVLRIAGLVVGIPLGLVLLLLLILHTGPAQNAIRDRIATRVGDRVNGSFALGELDFALFGDVTLTGVRITDDAGTEVVALDRLHLSPDWSALIGGQIAIDEVTVDGVRLALVEDDEGQLNIRSLFKKSPPKPKQPPKPKKDRHVVVRKLHVGGVNVTLEKKNGTVVTLKDFGLDGHLDVIPTKKTADVKLQLAAELRLEKPADGLRVTVSDIATGVSVDVTEGEGTLALSPSKAHATISQQGFDDREIDFSLDGVEAQIEPGGVGATLEKLALGAFVLQSLEIQGGMAEGSLSGDQKVQLVGLRLDSDRLNELLQKKLLKSDITIETKISGPPEAIAIDSTIDSSGGTVVVGGVVNASDRTRPEYALRVTATDIATDDLIESDKVPPITVERLNIGVRGAGRTRDSVEADIGIHVAGVRAKGYVIDDVVGEVRFDGGIIDLHPLKVEAYGHELLVNGWVDIDRKLVDARVTMAGDVGKTLANLRKGGAPIRTNLPRGLVVLHEDVVTVDIRGQLEGQLEADVAINDFRVLGGAIQGTAHASLFRNIDAGPDDQKVELQDLDAVIELKSINVGQALALRGKRLDGIAASVSGKVVIDDAPQAPWVDYDLAVSAQGSDRGTIDPSEPIIRARAHGRATKERLDLKLALDGSDAGDLESLLTAEVVAPLIITDTHKGIAPYRPLKVNVKIAEKRFKDITYYLPRKLLVDPTTGKERDIPRGSIEADIDIGGTAAQPEGELDVILEAKLHPLRRQRLKLDGTINSKDQPGIVIDTALGVWLDASEDQTLKGRIQAELPRSPVLPGPKDVDWKLDLELLPQTLQDWVEAKVVGLEGVAKAGIHLEGNRSDVKGSVTVDVERLKVKGNGPFGLHVGVGIEPERTTVDVDAQIDDTPVLAIAGHLGRPGDGLLAALRDKTPGKSTLDKLGTVPLAITIDVPKHAPKTYAQFRPKLAKLPGTFGGSIEVTGDLKTPLAEGFIGYQDFETISGKPGRAGLTVNAGADALNAAVEIGPVNGSGAPPIAIRLNVPRAEVKPYLDAKKCWENEDGEPCSEERLSIATSVDAHGVDLADLVPDFALPNRELKFAGTLDWDLDGDLKLTPKPRYRGEGEARVKLPPIAPDSKLDGILTLKDGTVALLDSGRHYEEIQLELKHDLSSIRLEQLALRESDLEKPERKLDVKAQITLDDFKPGKMDVHLSAKDWLVFGHEKVGPMDSPHAALDAEVKVTGDLGGPIKKIDVIVPKLALLAPDRFLRAHQPESLSSGDIIELKDGMEPGKLPLPIAKQPSTEDEAPEPEAPREDAPKGPPTGLDLHVSIPNEARVLLAPLDLVVKGDIALTRRGASKELKGELAVVDGSLSLGGKKHQLQDGKIVFENDCVACVELLYGKKPPETTLREASRASAGELVTIRLQGPLTDRTTTLGGTVSPGTLYDLLSAHNAGRPWHKSEPDMPATITVEYPHYENLLLLSYLSVNVPQFLFMDKVGAWADAYDGRSTESYGKITRYEAEGYSEDGDFRVRATARPPQAGSSENELSFDWMFANTPQTAFGVGVTGGDRLGGGPGIFFEWSSKD